MEQGQVSYVRDGERRRAGIFRGGLVGAVEGHDEAVRLARKARARKVAGGLIMNGSAVAGLMAYVLGPREWAKYAAPSAVGTFFLGLRLWGAGGAYEQAAINLFNDAHAECGPVAPVRPASRSE